MKLKKHMWPNHIGPVLREHYTVPGTVVEKCHAMRRAVIKEQSFVGVTLLRECRAMCGAVMRKGWSFRWYIKLNNFLTAFINLNIPHNFALLCNRQTSQADTLAAFLWISNTVLVLFIGNEKLLSNEHTSQSHRQFNWKHKMCNSFRNSQHRGYGWELLLFTDVQSLVVGVKAPLFTVGTTSQQKRRMR